MSPISGRRRSTRLASPRCQSSTRPACRSSTERPGSACRSRTSASSSPSASTTPTTPRNPAADPEGAVVFTKATSSLTGPNDDGDASRKDSHKTDWEVELGVVIGRRAALCRARPTRSTMSPATASSTTCRERDYQIERGGTWDKGKGCDTFGPVGPWLVTSGRGADPQALDMWLDVNGKRMQNGNTQDDDLRRRPAGQLRQPVHDAAAGRRHHHRHAARRRHGHEAPAGLPQARRRR